jgi:hypothetical protein
LVDAGANVALDAARAAQVLDGVDTVGHLARSVIIIGAEQRHDDVGA